MPVWEEAYTYDRSSRRLQREYTPTNNGYSDWSWRFAYDRLSRVVDSKRGKLASSTFNEYGEHDAYTLDELGNWVSVARDADGSGSGSAVAENRDHNATNEITKRGDEYRSYDDNGNLTRTGPSSSSASDDTRRLTFDAWNRLVSVELRESGSVARTCKYEYNGLNWRTVEIHLDASTSANNERRDLFYSASWQLLQETVRKGSAVNSSTGAVASSTLARQERQFYGLRGIDDAIYHRTDGDGDKSWIGTSDHAYYQLCDSSFSSVVLVDAASSQIIQRMNYDTYGARRDVVGADFGGDGFVDFFDYDDFVAAFEAESGCDFNGDGMVDQFDYDDYVAISESQPAWWATIEVRIGFCGYVRDSWTGWDLARNRWYDPAAGRWITRDPAGYVDGLSLYLYVKGNPLSMVDPTGLNAWADWWNSTTSLFVQPTRNTEQYGKVIGEGISDGDKVASNAACRALTFGMVGKTTDELAASGELYDPSDSMLKGSEACGTGAGILLQTGVTLGAAPLANTTTAAGRAVQLGIDAVTLNNATNTVEAGAAVVEKVIDGDYEGAAWDAGVMGISYAAGKAIARAGAPSSEVAERPAKAPVDKSWKGVIEGTAQKTGTPGHQVRSYREAIDMAKSGDYEKVYLNRSYRTTSDYDTMSLRRPDAIGVRNTGEIDAVEVLSRTDKPAKVLQRNVDAMRSLPPNRQGNIRLTRPQ